MIQLPLDRACFSCYLNPKGESHYETTHKNFPWSARYDHYSHLHYAAASKNDKKDAGKDLLAIEISVPGLKPLTVPVIAAGKKSAILPLTGAKASAVKIVSRLEGDSVKFDVLAVLDPLPEARTCEIVNQLKTELVVSHTAPAGR